MYTELQPAGIGTLYLQRTIFINVISMEGAQAGPVPGSVKQKSFTIQTRFTTYEYYSRVQWYVHMAGIRIRLSLPLGGDGP